MVNKGRHGCYKTPSAPIKGLKRPQLRPRQMPEIKHRANKLGCLPLKSDFCFNVVPSLIQFVAHWQRFLTSHISSILTSSPRVYLSSRHDASLPLRAIADTEAQTNKCAHMDPHMVYVQSREYRALLFAERVLLTTQGTHGFSTAAPQRARGRSGEKWAGRRMTALTSPILQD